MQTAPELQITKSERNYGIDLLRIISMLMIIVLHLMGHGGILKSAVPFSARYEALWFLETASYCAVNCYAIISGYVAVKSKFKYSNIVYLWLQVVFYAVLIAVIMAIISPSINKEEVTKAFFPVSNRIYWYFTAYFCCYFFTPIFNKAIEHFSEKQLKAIAVTIFILFCIVPILAEKDTFIFNRGYSPIWLIMLYILGGIINKCHLLNKIKSWVLMLLYLLIVVLTWGERLICDYHNAHYPKAEPFKIVLTNYLSPTIFLAAVFLFIGFSKLKVAKNLSKIIELAASASFGVYLIHDNPYIRNIIIKKIAAVLLNLNTSMLVIGIIITVIFIYIICAAIDIVREKIFKLLKIKESLHTLENKFLKNLW